MNAAEYKKKIKESPLESRFLALWEKYNKNIPIVREYRFHPERRWRFDFCHLASKTAIEAEGGTWAPIGRHTSPIGFQNDCEKYNEAIFEGWKVFRLTNKHITIDMIQRIGNYCGGIK